MPVEFGIWRVAGDTAAPVPTSALANEARLEAIIERDPSILGLGNLFVVGRQVVTPYATRIDLLALDGAGTLYVIEVKKGRTPREVVAQALDYGYWASELTLDELAERYARDHEGETLEQTFRDRIDAELPEALSGDHRLVVVASSLDPQTDRIVRYVRDQGVPIYVVFFQYFAEREHEFLARTWDADPARVDAVGPPRRRAPRPAWNGQDFYVTFGDVRRRSWDDARRYGFVSGGGGRRWSKPFEQLFVGARVFVLVPKSGYVAVGTVEEEAKPIRDFTIEIDGRTVPILQAPLVAPEIGEDAEDDERSERLVRVRWIRSVPKERGFWEKGLFAHQRTVLPMRDQDTLTRLVEHFRISDENDDTARIGAVPGVP